MNKIQNATATFLAACLLGGTALAQTTHPPLDLRLPPGSVPAAAGTNSPPPNAGSQAKPGDVAPASSAPDRHASPLQIPPSNLAATASADPTYPTHDAHGNPTSPPGVYYGDTSGRTYRAAEARAPACNDSTYNQPQTHGSVSMGVMGGSHMSGNYQAGTINVTKNLGSCEHPTGSVGFSISVGQSRFGGRGW